MNVKIDEVIYQLFPSFQMGYVIANKVKVNPSNFNLQLAMDSLCQKVGEGLTVEKVREQTVVKMTKESYRKLGKDPNRYRPSAESLLRRIASGKGLYHINNMVDILNMVSVATGFSIGGYDMDKIQGEVSLGKGKENEPYEGIGRGALNIENLPVFRDSLGAFGTPTSDSIRTMVTADTTRFLMLFPFFEGDRKVLNNTLECAVRYIQELGGGDDVVSWII